MNRIISLLAALMIFTFSFMGEAVHASNASHADSEMTQKVESTSVSHADAFQSESHDQHGSLVHDCHFGHCAFTVMLPASMKSPIPYLGKPVHAPQAFVLSHFRSETLRPPSLL